jgi:hypothetical protein
MHGRIAAWFVGSPDKQSGSISESSGRDRSPAIRSGEHA